MLLRWIDDLFALMEWRNKNIKPEKEAFSRKSRYGENNTDNEFKEKPWNQYSAR